jgi:hypothetical protein
MVPEINWWAVIAATLSTMVVGTIWYAPKVFGNWWEKAAKVEMKGSAVTAIIITVIVSFISAWVLAGAAAIAQEFYGGSFLVNSIITALILWAGFTAARFITHDAFENRPRMLTLLNISHELVTFLIMALIIGLFGISAA